MKEAPLAEKQKTQILRGFLVSTVCWNCKGSSSCNLHYYPVDRLCHPLETDISQFLRGTNSKHGSSPPSIILEEERDE